MLIVDYGRLVYPFGYGNGNPNNNVKPQSEEGEVISPPCINHVIMRGDTGKCVVLVQQILKRLGYYDKEITGEFDQDTEMALLKFQKDNSDFVEETGVVDEDTWNLLEMYAEPYEICLIESDNPNCFEEATKIVGSKFEEYLGLFLLGGLALYLFMKERKEEKERRKRASLERLLYLKD